MSISQTKRNYGCRSWRTTLELNVESLEQRQLLAGNVVANIDSDGNLTITGDGRSNNIEVVIDHLEFVHITGHEETNVTGDYSGIRVTGLDIDVSMKGGHDTVLITSDSVIPFNVLIQTAGGHDRVQLELQDSNAVNVNTGGGSDEVSISGSELTDLHVSTVGGNDSVNVTSTFISGDAVVSTGGGKDATDVYQVTGSSDFSIHSAGGKDRDGVRLSTVSNLSVVSTGGDDGIFLSKAQVTGDLAIDSGGGSDSIGVSYHTTVAADLSIVTRGGADTVVLSQADVSPATTTATLEIDTGSGADDIQILNDSIIDGSIVIDAGSGKDVLRCVESTLTFAVFSMGSGADFVSIAGLSGFVRADGGSGADELALGLQYVGAFVQHEDFEIVGGPI